MSIQERIKISRVEYVLILSISALFIFAALFLEKEIALLVGLLPVLGYLLFFKTETLWWITVFLTPLSISLESLNGSDLGLYLPTEPLLALFLVLTPLYFILKPPPQKFLLHPISLIIIAYVGWTFITAITSVQIIVSLKNTIAQLWFIVPIYFLGYQWMNQPNKGKQFLKTYTFSFALVVVYTFVNLYLNDFPEKASQWLMNPFFKDHTILGAVLGITIPFITLQVFQKDISRSIRLSWILLACLFYIVLIFTYSRAAILSLIAALVIYGFIELKLSIKTLFRLAGFCLVIIAFNWSSIIAQLSQNQSESSGEVIENIESISNISTDASNVERINRWNAALLMWQAKPIFGWGPGTYQFQYAPYQNSRDMTIISTNVGDVGNAHSEFLGMLAESGLPGALIKLLWVLTVFYYGYRLALIQGKHNRLVLLSCLLGFVAYFTHGILNNFLLSDKAAVPIWAFTLIIVCLDLQQKSLSQTSEI